MVAQMEDIASPVGAFMREKCDLHPDAEILTKDLFDAWKAWCDVDGEVEERYGRRLKLRSTACGGIPQRFDIPPTT